MCQSAADQKPSADKSSEHSLLKVLFSGSRRIKLWELPEMFHCPVIGVCMSTKTIQRLITQVSAKPVVLTEYESHSIAVNACQQRGPLSERLQKELDAKHNLAIQQCHSLDTSTALLSSWKTAVSKGNIAGCFWALITHPRTTSAVRETIYRDVHMIQHQAGASIRVDLEAFNALGRENATLLRELGRIQTRMSDFAQEKTALIDRLNGDLLKREHELVRLKEELREMELTNLRLSGADLVVRENQELKEEVQRLSLKNSEQAFELTGLRKSISVALKQTKMSSSENLQSATDAPEAKPRVPVALTEKTVFLVGGRLGSLSEYRSTVESSGARFVFHDGGLEQSLSSLESGLQAADYVICQTGCISHASYWKVKDFCKRTGKQCVYVETPSVTSLRHSMGQLGQRL